VVAFVVGLEEAAPVAAREGDVVLDAPAVVVGAAELRDGERVRELLVVALDDGLARRDRAVAAEHVREGHAEEPRGAAEVAVARRRVGEHVAVVEHDEVVGRRAAERVGERAEDAHGQRVRDVRPVEHEPPARRRAVGARRTVARAGVEVRRRAPVAHVLGHLRPVLHARHLGGRERRRERHPEREPHRLLGGHCQVGSLALAGGGQPRDRRPPGPRRARDRRGAHASYTAGEIRTPSAAPAARARARRSLLRS